MGISFGDKHDETHARNLEHAQNPIEGDYWHEMYSPQCVVVAVTDTSVTVLDKTIRLADGCYTFDLEHTTTYSREVFKYRYTYGYTNNKEFRGLAGDPDHTQNKYWADVIPKKRTCVVDAYQKQTQGVEANA